MTSRLLNKKQVLDRLWEGCRVRVRVDRQGYRKFLLVDGDRVRGRAHYSAIDALKTRGKLVQDGDDFFLVKRAVRGAAPNEQYTTKIAAPNRVIGSVEAV